jgi:Ca2+-binding EF-hand superfamily protein
MRMSLAGTLRHVAIAAALSIASGLTGSAARAQTPPPTYDPRAAFAEADTNHDGAVDHEEFVERMTEVFYAADVNKDGKLSPTEVTATLTETTNLKAADSNGDGVLTLHEFLRARLKDYDLADTNGDGLLELDEVVKIYELGRKP